MGAYDKDTGEGGDNMEVGDADEGSWSPPGFASRNERALSREAYENALYGESRERTLYGGYAFCVQKSDTSASSSDLRSNYNCDGLSFSMGHSCAMRSQDKRRWGQDCPSQYGNPSSWGYARYRVSRANYPSWAGNTRAWDTGVIVIASKPTMQVHCNGGTSTATFHEPYYDSGIRGIVWNSDSAIFSSHDAAVCRPRVELHVSMTSGSNPLSAYVTTATPWTIANYGSGVKYFVFSADSTQPAIYSSQFDVLVRFVMKCGDGYNPAIEYLEVHDDAYNVGCGTGYKITTGMNTFGVEARGCAPGYYQDSNGCYQCPTGSYNPDYHKVRPTGSTASPSDPQFATKACANCLCPTQCVTCPAGSTSATCSQRTNTNQCYIGGNCFPSGPHPAATLATCKYCNPSSGTYTYWSMTHNCGTKIISGVETCRCSIGGQCYDPYEVNPANPVCQWCDPEVSSSSWTTKPNTCVHSGGSCGCIVDGGTCVAADSKPATSDLNPCQVCDPERASIGYSVIDNTCLYDSTHCGCKLPDGSCVQAASRPSEEDQSVCLICDPPSNPSDYTIDVPGACLTPGGVCGCTISEYLDDDEAPTCYALHEPHPDDADRGRCLRCDYTQTWTEWSVYKGCFNGVHCGCTIGENCIADGHRHFNYTKCQSCDFDASVIQWTYGPVSGDICSTDGIGDEGNCTHTDICKLDEDGIYRCQGTPYECPIGECERSTVTWDPPCDGQGGCHIESREPEECRPYIDACTVAVNCTSARPDCPLYTYEPDALDPGTLSWGGNDAFQHPTSDLFYIRSKTLRVSPAGLDNTCLGAPRFYRLSYYLVESNTEDTEGGCADLTGLGVLLGNETAYFEDEPGSLPSVIEAPIDNSSLLTDGSHIAMVLEVRGLLPVRHRANVEYEEDPVVPSSLWRRVCTPPAMFDGTPPVWSAASSFVRDITPLASESDASDPEVDYVCWEHMCGEGEGCEVRATARFSGLSDSHSQLLYYNVTVWTKWPHDSAWVSGEEVTSIPSEARLLASSVEYDITANAVDVNLEGAGISEGTLTRTCVQGVNSAHVASVWRCGDELVWLCDRPTKPQIAFQSSVYGVDETTTLYYSGPTDDLLLTISHGLPGVAPLASTRVRVYIDGTPSDGVTAPNTVTTFSPASTLSNGSWVFPLDSNAGDGEEILVEVREYTVVESGDVYSESIIQAIADRSVPVTAGLSIGPMDPATLGETPPTSTSSSPTYTSMTNKGMMFVLGGVPSEPHSPPIWYQCAVANTSSASSCGFVSAYTRCEYDGDNGGVWRWDLPEGHLEDGSRGRVCLSVRNQAGISAEILMSEAELVFDASPPNISTITIGSTTATPGGSAEWVVVDDAITASWISEDLHSPLTKTEVAIGVNGGGNKSEILQWTTLSSPTRRFVDDLAVTSEMTHGESYRFYVRVTNGAGLRAVGVSNPFTVDLTDPAECDPVDLHKEEVIARNAAVLPDTDWRRSDDWMESDTLRLEELSKLYVGLDFAPTKYDDLAPMEKVIVQAFRCDGTISSNPLGPAVTYSKRKDMYGRRVFFASTTTPMSNHDEAAGEHGYCVHVRLVTESTRTSTCVTDGVFFTPDAPSVRKVSDVDQQAPEGTVTGVTPLDLVGSYADLDYTQENASIVVRFPVITDVAGVVSMSVQVVMEDALKNAGRKKPGPWLPWSEEVDIPTSYLPPTEVDIVSIEGANGTIVELSRGTSLTAVRMWPTRVLEDGVTYSILVRAKNPARIRAEGASNGIRVITSILHSGPVTIEPFLEQFGTHSPLNGVGGGGGYGPIDPLVGAVVTSDLHIPGEGGTEPPPILVKWDVSKWIARSDDTPLRYQVCLIPATATEKSSIPQSEAYELCDPSSHPPTTLPFVYMGLNASSRVRSLPNPTFSDGAWHAFNRSHVIARFGNLSSGGSSGVRAVVEAVGTVPGTAVYGVSGPFYFDNDVPSLNVGVVGIQARSSPSRAAPFTLFFANTSASDNTSEIASCYLTIGTSRNGAELVRLRRLPSCPGEDASKSFMIRDVFRSVPLDLAVDGAKIWIRLIVEDRAGWRTTARPSNNINTPLLLRFTPPIPRALPSILGTRSTDRILQERAAFFPTSSWNSTTSSQVCLVPRFDSNAEALCRVSILDWSDGGAGVMDEIGGNGVVEWLHSINVRANRTLARSSSWIPCGPNVDASGLNLEEEVFVAVKEAAEDSFVTVFSSSVPDILAQAPLARLRCAVEACTGEGRLLPDGSIATSSTPTSTTPALCTAVLSSSADVDTRVPAPTSWVTNSPKAGDVLGWNGTVAMLDTSLAPMVVVTDGFGGSDVEDGTWGRRPFLAAEWEAFHSRPDRDGFRTAPISKVEAVAIAVYGEKGGEWCGGVRAFNGSMLCPSLSGSEEVVGRGVSAWWNQSIVHNEALHLAQRVWNGDVDVKGREVLSSEVWVGPVTLPGSATRWSVPERPLPLTTSLNNVTAVVVCVRAETLAGVHSEVTCSETGVTVVQTSITMGPVELWTSPWSFEVGDVENPLDSSTFSKQNSTPSSIRPVSSTSSVFQSHLDTVAVRVGPIQPGLAGLQDVVLTIGSGEGAATVRGAHTSAQQVLLPLSLPSITTLSLCNSTSPPSIFDVGDSWVGLCVWGGGKEVRAADEAFVQSRAATGTPLPEWTKDLHDEVEDRIGDRGEWGLGWGTDAMEEVDGVVLVIGGPGLQLRNGLDVNATLAVRSRLGDMLASTSNPLRIDTSSASSGDVEIIGDGTTRVRDQCVIPHSPGVLACRWTPLRDPEVGLCHSRVTVSTSRGYSRTFSLAPPSLRTVAEQESALFGAADNRRVGSELREELAELGVQLDPGFQGVNASNDVVVAPQVRVVGSGGVSEWSLYWPVTDEANFAVASRFKALVALEQNDTNVDALESEAGELESTAENVLVDLIGEEVWCQVQEISCAGSVLERTSPHAKVSVNDTPALGTDVTGIISRTLETPLPTRLSSNGQAWIDDGVEESDGCDSLSVCVDAPTTESCPVEGVGMCVMGSASALSFCKTTTLSVASVANAGVVRQGDELIASSYFPRSLFPANATRLCLTLVSEAAAKLSATWVDHETGQMWKDVEDHGEVRSSLVRIVSNDVLRSGEDAWIGVVGVDSIGRATRAVSSYLGVCDPTPPLVHQTSTSTLLLASSPLFQQPLNSSTTFILPTEESELRRDEGEDEWDALERFVDEHGNSTLSGTGVGGVEDEVGEFGADYFLGTALGGISSAPLATSRHPQNLSEPLGRWGESALVSSCFADLALRAAHALSPSSSPPLNATGWLAEAVADQTALRSVSTQPPLLVSATSDRIVTAWTSPASDHNSGIAATASGVMALSLGTSANPATSCGGVAIRQVSIHHLSSTIDNTTIPPPYTTPSQPASITKLHDNTPLPLPPQPPAEATPTLTQGQGGVKSRPARQPTAVPPRTTSSLQDLQAIFAEGTRRNLLPTALTAISSLDVSGLVSSETASSTIFIPVAAAENTVGGRTVFIGAPLLRAPSTPRPVHPLDQLDVQPALSQHAEHRVIPASDLNDTIVASDRTSSGWITSDRDTLVCDFAPFMDDTAPIVGVDAVLVAVEEDKVRLLAAQPFTAPFHNPTTSTLLPWIGSPTSWTPQQIADASVLRGVTGFKVVWDPSMQESSASWPSSSGTAGVATLRAALPTLSSTVADGSRLRCLLRAWNGAGASSAWQGVERRSGGVEEMVGKDFDGPVFNSTSSTSTPILSLHGWTRTAAETTLIATRINSKDPRPFVSPSKLSSYLTPLDPDVFQRGPVVTLASQSTSVRGSFQVCDQGSRVVSADVGVVLIPKREGERVSEAFVTTMDALPHAWDGAVEMEGEDGGESWDALETKVRSAWEKGAVGGGVMVGRYPVVVSSSSTCVEVDDALIASRSQMSAAMSAIDTSHWSGKWEVVAVVVGRNEAGLTRTTVMELGEVEAVGKVGGEMEWAEGSDVMAQEDLRVRYNVSFDVSVAGIFVETWDAFTGLELHPPSLVDVSDVVGVLSIGDLLNNAGRNLVHGSVVRVRVSFVNRLTGEITTKSLPLGVIDSIGVHLSPAAISYNTPTRLVSDPFSLVFSWDGAFTPPFPPATTLLHSTEDRDIPFNATALNASTDADPDAVSYEGNNFTTLADLDEGAPITSLLKPALSELVSLRERSTTTQYTIYHLSCTADACIDAALNAVWEPSTLSSSTSYTNAWNEMQRLGADGGKGLRSGVACGVLGEAVRENYTTFLTHTPSQLTLSTTSTFTTNTTLLPETVSIVGPGSCIVVIVQATVPSGRKEFLAPAFVGVVDGRFMQSNDVDISLTAWDVGAGALNLSKAVPSVGLPPYASSADDVVLAGLLITDPIAIALYGGSTLAAATLPSVQYPRLPPLTFSSTAQPYILHGDGPILGTDVDCQTNSSDLVVAWTLQGANVGVVDGAWMFRVAVCVLDQNSEECEYVAGWQDVESERLARITNLNLPTSSLARVGVAAFTRRGAHIATTWTDGVRIEPQSGCDPVYTYSD